MWEREYGRPIFCSLAEIELSLQRCDAPPFPFERWEYMLVFARIYTQRSGWAEVFFGFSSIPDPPTRYNYLYPDVQYKVAQSGTPFLRTLPPPPSAHTLTWSLFLNRQLSTSTTEFLLLTPHRVTFDTNQRVPWKYTVDVCTKSTYYITEKRSDQVQK